MSTSSVCKCSLLSAVRAVVCETSFLWLINSFWQRSSVCCHLLNNCNDNGHQQFLKMDISAYFQASSLDMHAPNYIIRSIRISLQFQDGGHLIQHCGCLYFFIVQVKKTGESIKFSMRIC